VSQAETWSKAPSSCSHLPTPKPWSLTQHPTSTRPPLRKTTLIYDIANNQILNSKAGSIIIYPTATNTPPSKVPGSVRP
jgi:hypothetical protein